MKRFFRSIHLYLSLAAGLVIITCCFTGAILVFEKELQHLFNPKRYFVEQQPTRLPFTRLIENVQQQYPAAKISGVKVYGDAERSVEVNIALPSNKNGENIKREEKNGTQPGVESGSNTAALQPGLSNNTKGGKEEKATAAKGGSRPSHTVFINQYTGEVLELYSYRETFFYTMFALHRWLLGSESSIGKTITGVATLIFLVILITGIILWWPRNKAILQQRLKIKVNASWKRLNHDFHIVLGFYSAIFLFIFAFTALAWSFKWFNNGIYTVTGSTIKLPEPPVIDIQAGAEKINYDIAYAAIQLALPNAVSYTLRSPADSTDTFTATVLPKGVHESATDQYFIDPFSGKIIGSLKFDDKNLGQRVRASFKPIHTGSIWGLPSKMIAFIVCLLGVTFPITGVIMWLNRLKKNKATLQE